MSRVWTKWTKNGKDYVSFLAVWIFHLSNKLICFFLFFCIMHHNMQSKSYGVQLAGRRFYFQNLLENCYHVYKTKMRCNQKARTNGITTRQPFFFFCPQLSCLCKWSASDWAQFGIPLLAAAAPPTRWTLHVSAALCYPPLWTHSTAAQRNSFSNFPWLRKQYTCLNNVDISNALKRSSNEALIGSKWIHAHYKHTQGSVPSLYWNLSDLNRITMLEVNEGNNRNFISLFWKNLHFNREHLKFF